jgi:hypothetical protein
VTPTATATPTISISKTPSVTPTISISTTPSLTPTLTPTLSVTPSPTATFPACAVVLNSVTYVSGTTWSYNFTAGTSCGTILLEYSNDGTTWGNNAGSCTSPRTTSIGGISGTLYFRITMICNLGGPAVSNVIIVNNVSATPTPTISLTPTPTRTISVTPTVTPTISVSRTPSVTPSTSAPALIPSIYSIGATAGNACNFGFDFDFCTDTGDLCTATVLYDSDGVNCLGTQPAAGYFSDLSNSRYWNGTSWGGSCVICSGCLTLDTLITMANGLTKPVQDVQIGDEVKSLSVEGMPQDANDWYSWSSSDMIYTDSTATVNNITTIETNKVYDINNGLLTATATHNHVVKHNGSWYIKQTAKLVVGDILLNNNGELIEIESITVINQAQTVYNLDVTNSNLYFANGVLTHNK